MSKQLYLFKLFICITISCSSKITFAQAPDIEWQNTIGGSSSNYLRSIIQTADGGYVLGGDSQSGISGDKTEVCQGRDDYWIVKLDPTGQTIEWQNTIGGSMDDNLYSIQQTSDGGYILGGTSESGISGDKTEENQLDQYPDYWVVKLDATGQTIEWQNTIGGRWGDDLRSIKQTTDGGYILGGHSYSRISGDKTEESTNWDFWVLKLDPTGQIIEWQNTIEGSSYKMYSIHQTTDGGYILGGETSSNYMVVKLDATGQTIEWQKIIGGDWTDELRSIQQTSDGGYVLGGYSWSGLSDDKTEANQGFYGTCDYWIVKLDATGQTIEWQNTIGGEEWDNLYSIQQTFDGGYILGGYSNSPISADKTKGSLGTYDYWVVKLDATGQTIEWQKTIGGSEGDNLWSIQQTSDGGYVLGGFSWSGVSGDKTEANQGYNSYWVVKLYSDNPLGVEQTSLTPVIENFTILPAYPNPFNPSTTISYGLEKDSFVVVEIYDIAGKIISTLHNDYQAQGWHSVLWNGTNNKGEQVPAGLYLSKITSGNEVNTIKLMLLK